MTDSTRLDALLMRADSPQFISSLLNSWHNQLFFVKKQNGVETTICTNARPTKQGGHAQLTVGTALKRDYSEAAALLGDKVLVHVMWAIAFRMTALGELTRVGKTFTVTAQAHVPFSVAGGDYSHKLAPSRPSDGPLDWLAGIKASNPELHFSEDQWVNLESIECHGITGQESPRRNQARKICSMRGRPEPQWVSAGLLCRCYLLTDGPECEFW